MLSQADLGDYESGKEIPEPRGSQRLHFRATIPIVLCIKEKVTVVVVFS